MGWTVLYIAFGIAVIAFFDPNSAPPVGPFS